MSREWQPGDVAIVKFSSGEHRALLDDDGTWMVVGKGNSHAYYVNRPIVVIDPEDREAVERLADVIARSGVHRGRVPRVAETNGLSAALREYADPTPPKPDEPQGRYAVVVDDEGNEWLRGPSGAWIEQHTGDRAAQQPHFRMLDYDRIAVVRVLSPGVEVDQ